MSANQIRRLGAIAIAGILFLAGLIYISPGQPCKVEPSAAIIGDVSTGVQRQEGDPNLATLLVQNAELEATPWIRIVKYNGKFYVARANMEGTRVTMFARECTTEQAAISNVNLVIRIAGEKAPRELPELAP